MWGVSSSGYLFHSLKTFRVIQHTSILHNCIALLFVLFYFASILMFVYNRGNPFVNLLLLKCYSYLLIEQSLSSKDWFKAKYVISLNNFINIVLNLRKENEIRGRKCQLWSNKALWLDAASHMTSFNQLECFISAQHIYAVLKFVYDAGAS